MIHVSRNIEFLNHVMNHESVHPYITLGIDAPLDASQVLANPQNLFLADEHGGFLMVWISPGLYEVHTQFLPDGRGAQALVCAKEAELYMFSMTDCEAIETSVEVSNRPARLFTLQAGFKKIGMREELGNQMIRYRLNKLDWVKSCQQ